MTRAETTVDEIRGRLEKATAGKWVRDGLGSDGSWEMWTSDDTRFGKSICFFNGDLTRVKECHANADFVAHAPTDIAFLLSDRDAMRKEIDLLQMENRRHKAEIDTQIAELGRMQSQTAALAQALNEIADKSINTWARNRALEAIATLPARAEAMVKAQAHLAAMRGALEPFAKAAGYFDAHADIFANSVMLNTAMKAGVTIGDLRRAREALSQAPLSERAGVVGGVTTPRRIERLVQFLRNSSVKRILFTFDGEQEVCTPKYLLASDRDLIIAALLALPPSDEPREEAEKE